MNFQNENMNHQPIVKIPTKIFSTQKDQFRRKKNQLKKKLVEFWKNEKRGVGEVSNRGKKSTRKDNEVCDKQTKILIKCNCYNFYYF